MEDLQDKIIELMDLFDDEQVTTADKIDRPQSSLDREAYSDFMKRNPMAGGGMLVQPSADGSRPGYAKDKRQYKSAEEKYTGSAKPPKKKKWQGVFGKEKADEIYNDYVKFYTDAYNNKNMSQVGEAEEYFKKVYGEKDGRKAADLLKRNGYTNLKAAPYELKQKLLIELVDDAQSKLKFTNKFDIIDKVFTESAAKQARANGLSSFLGKGDGRLRLSWFTNDLFNKVDGIDKIEDKISKALDYMVENNIEIKDVKKATGSVFTQGTSAGDKSRMSPIKKTIVSLVDNGKDGISRALLNKGIQKNAWYQSQTQNGKNLFDYVSREYGTEFIGEGFLDAYESGKSRFGRVTVKGSTQMPLPESLIFQFAARSADRNFKAGTYEDGPVKITDLKGNELDFGSLPVNERGQRIIDPSKHKFTYNGTLYGKNNLRKLGYQSGDFTEVYQIASDFKSYGDELVPNPKNPNGKKITFRQLMDMSGIDLFMAIGHDDSKGGVRTRPFNNFQIQNKFVNKSLDSAYRQVKNKDLRKRIADDIYGDLKGLRGQAYKDAWIKNNTKLLNDIILNRNIPPSLYRQAGENIIKSDVFQTFSKKKQDEVIRVSGLNKTEVDKMLAGISGNPKCQILMRKQKADGGRIGYQSGTVSLSKCAEDGARVINSGMKNANSTQLKNFAAFANRAKNLGRNIMKFGIIPEAMYVAADATIRLTMGDKPTEALLRASEYLLPGDQTKLAEMMEAKRLSSPETAAIIGRSIDYKNQLAKIDSLTSQRDNLENLSGGGEFDYIGDLNQDVRNLDNQIKQATDNLNANFKMTDAELIYANRMQDEVDDIRKSKSFLTKIKSMFRDTGQDASDVETLGAPEKTQEQLNKRMADLLPRDLLLASEAEMIQAAKIAQAQGFKIPDDYYIQQQQAVKNMSLAELAAATSPEQVYGAQGYIAEPLFKGVVEKPQNIIGDMEREITGQTNVANPFDIDLSMIGSGLRGFSAAGGGIAKEAGVDSGVPPESGPNPQGLSYLMKRGKNI